MGTLAEGVCNLAYGDEVQNPSRVRMVQKMKMKGDEKTFSQLAEASLTMILHEGVQSDCIDVVFDVYKEPSINGAERCNRSSGGAIQFSSIAPGHSIQQWRKLLGSSSNNASLVRFLVEEWKQAKHREKLQNKLLYVTCDDLCYKLTIEHCEAVGELQSTHEEADTQMLLHALHAAQAGYKAVVITAEDADVLPSTKTYHALFIKSVEPETAHFQDINRLARALGDNVCTALVGLHLLTGCDTVSAFAGRGKLTALKQLKTNRTHQEAFGQVGQSWDASRQLFQKLQEITCRLYLPSTRTRTVNELRYQICAGRGEVESSQLPPCEDCLFMHVLRANYQVAIWRRCLQSRPIVPCPTGH